MPAPIKPSLTFSPSFLFDALIIGAGPAGLSAALALCRQARPAAVFSTSVFRNDRAKHAHSVLSRDHQSPAEIRGIGREQIEAYGTTHFVERGIRSARRDDNTGYFEAKDEMGEVWRGRKVVLAMGVRDDVPEIEGYAENWGQSIYHCLFCEGLERADRPAAILGAIGPDTVRVLGMVGSIGVERVTVLTDGPMEVKGEAAERALKVIRAKGVCVDERKIQKLVGLPGGDGLEVVFEEGGKLELGFLQHNPAYHIVAPQIAEGLGVDIVPDGMGGMMLKTDGMFCQTNVPGVFAAGDAGALIKQATNAMFQGNVVGGGICMQLMAEADAELLKKAGE